MAFLETLEGFVLNLRKHEKLKTLLDRINKGVTYTRLSS
jgi:hypothetical protein